jgi:hypothetical protein
VWQLDKSKNDPPEPTPTMATNPALIKQNLGITGGLYQTTGPVHFSLEYFRAQHTWFDRGVADPNNPAAVRIVTPKQSMNFVNVGMTVVW